LRERRNGFPRHGEWVVAKFRPATVAREVVAPEILQYRRAKFIGPCKKFAKAGNGTGIRSNFR
jgi:hypothetical protein